MDSILRLLGRAPWTLAFTALLLLVNLELFAGGSGGASLLRHLEYDRAAVDSGEVWRLLSGNLTHWSPEHFWLDVGAFLWIGLLYESRWRSRGRTQRGSDYALALTATGIVVGLALHYLQPDVLLYRGLSGVVSGQFAAAMLLELEWARGTARYLTLGACCVFLVKLVYELSTGDLFFSTATLGDLGLPSPMSHVSGAIAGVAAVRLWHRRREVRSAPSTGAAALNNS